MNTGLRRTMPYLGVATCLVIVIFLGIVGTLMFTNGTSKNALNQKASKPMGQKVVIPHFKSYPMTGVIVVPEPNNRKSLVASYGFKKGKLDQKATDSIKNHQHKKVLYGVYSGGTALRIDFSPGHASLGDSGKKTKMIGLHKISYAVIKRPGFKGMVAMFNANKGNYTFEFPKLQGKLTEENAFKMIGKLIQKMK